MPVYLRKIVRRRQFFLLLTCSLLIEFPLSGHGVFCTKGVAVTRRFVKDKNIATFIRLAEGESRISVLSKFPYSRYLNTRC